eukprot:TRINITY_DN4091_c0_g2_i1.p1 TRINITY_DN4091_c0_g2~~TRINITY_DN4091_c0_g2_i1.p1  ORF type:complete len:837 (-),score=221.40 TRINITY_DN4091_c0_g2_i1:55-2565(-)
MELSHTTSADSVLTADHIQLTRPLSHDERFRPPAATPAEDDQPPRPLQRSSYSADHLSYMKHKIVFGICAMAKKTGGKPMKEILRRMGRYNDFEIVVFEEDMILNQPVDQWPRCDALLSWFSTGFPLDKAIEYADLRRPFLVNDLRSQWILQDRRKVFRKCAEYDIALPRHAFVNRDGCEWKNAREEVDGPSVLEEEEDMICINGVVFQKPFVEKPVSGENHNIYIYYPKSAGGGVKKLFRKTGDKSSEYCEQEWQVRREGSYIYEDFLPTEGVDVKVYAVGDEYAHAEARKAPTLDGRVQRDQGGNEVRYPVVLSYEEKVMANKIVSAFGQFICGFDVLRSMAGSFVCDVNGFSFVKKSKKYYDDTVFIVRTLILNALVPTPDLIRYATGGMPILAMEMDEEDEETELSADDLAALYDQGALPSFNQKYELRCVIGVVRHGDRTPKQKMKLKLTIDDEIGSAYLSLFDLLGSPGSHKELKLKKVGELTKLLDITTQLIDSHGWVFNEDGSEGEEAELKDEQPQKLHQMKAVLEMFGEFTGINRKAQIKPTKWAVLEDGVTERVTAGLLVMKWGGELTKNGKIQAEELGRWARESLYMGESAGLLRLHASYRHDLKIYSSDEGRVQMTAAAFAKGFLDLEGELPPILVGLVRKDGINALLDETEPAERDLESTKARLYPLVNSDKDVDADMCALLNPDQLMDHHEFLATVNNFRLLLDEIAMEVRGMKRRIWEHKTRLDGDEQPTSLYHDETPELFYARWKKLSDDFYNSKTDSYDISKLPDLLDNIKYDLMHNIPPFEEAPIWSLYEKTAAFAAFVVSQEYGICLLYTSPSPRDS